MFKVTFLLLFISIISLGQKNHSDIKSPAAIGETYLLDINNLKLPINNRGTIADVNAGGVSGGYFDNNTILYSAGFLLSGRTNDTLWGNGQATASLIKNYQPGPVNSNPLDSNNVFYIVAKSDPDFGPSWQEYKDAVTLGADFYDGDGDNLYAPVDKNSNGHWDMDEDKPNIFGDITAWCVYNDGVNPRVRFPGVLPQGIEIHQTAFAYEGSSGVLSNAVFFRYKIINRGTVADNMDSVYFSIWSDPDIGDFMDDLVGCDVLLNAGYCYSNKSDNIYGANPPALLTGILQGPVKYIPGVSFIDINSNGIYDHGTDTPLDTAFEYKGTIGLIMFPGARNLSMNSFVHYQQSDPVLGDPNTQFELQNYMEGKNKSGGTLNPCTWNLGQVTGGVNCSSVYPYFWYSGDPVANSGWINKINTDQRLMVNAGPFILEKDKPVEIIAAYVAGRGNSPLSSVSIAKGKYRDIKNYFNFPISDIENEMQTISKYTLMQNYPNPFNPSTVIKYSVPEAGNVKIILYNALGQEIMELVSGFKSAGTYELNLNAGSLSSGVYFYRLTASSSNGKNNFTAARKLMLLK